MDDLTVCLRPMTLDDVDEVHLLDSLAYPIAWPVSVYTREIRANTSLFFVLETPVCASKGEQGLMRLFRGARPRFSRLIGFSGMWYVIDEAHISTIAVHPEWHGNKLGELLFWNMVRHAFYLGVEKITLEVRVSNTVAQNLYTKYGLEIASVRKRYYSDNGEDAYMMVNNNFTASYREWVGQRGKDLFSLLNIVDHANPDKVPNGQHE